MENKHFNTTHGLSQTPEYQAWFDMKNRCLNPSRKEYQHYGGRGIKVCSDWLESVENFYLDMGPRPGPKYTLDRIDTNGHYEPGNCRWVPWSVQVANRRPKEVCINGHKYDVVGYYIWRNTRTCGLCKKLKDAARYRRLK